MRFNLHFFPVLCIAIIALTGLMSCGDIQQDLRLNKDGSGTLETIIDAGELLTMAKGFENMGSDHDTFSDDMTPDTLITTPPVEKEEMTKLIDKITDPSNNRDLDTTMSYISIMPDSLRQKETRPDLLEKMFVRIKSTAGSDDLSFGILMNFDHTKQLREMINHLESLNETSSMVSGSSPVGMDSETFMAFDADMKEGWIRVDTVMYAGFSEQMGLPQDSAGTEDMSMMEMLFGNSKIKSVIHVPGEVLSCTNPDAILTKDNRV